MSKKTNWIKLYRRLAKSDLWLSEPFSRGQAWVDLILLATFDRRHVRIRGIKVLLERGQLTGSTRFLSLRWKWSRGKVSRFLNELESERMIDQEKNDVTTVITITNFDEHQADRTTNRATSDTTDGPQTEPQTGHKQDHIQECIQEGYQESNQECSKTDRFEHDDASRQEEIPTDKIINRWNRLKGVKPIRGLCLSAIRRQAIIERERENPKFCDELLEALEMFPLPGYRDGMDVPFDFLLKPGSVEKILEGHYSDSATSNGKHDQTDRDSDSKHGDQVPEDWIRARKANLAKQREIEKKQQEQLEDPEEQRKIVKKFLELERKGMTVKWEGLEEAREQYLASRSYRSEGAA